MSILSGAVRIFRWALGTAAFLVVFWIIGIIAKPGTSSVGFLTGVGVGIEAFFTGLGPLIRDIFTGLANLIKAL